MDILWRELQKLGLQSITGWWHLTRTILSSCLEDSDTKQFHLLLKFHQQGMHNALCILEVWTRLQEMQGLGKERYQWSEKSLSLVILLWPSLCYLWLSQRESLLYSKHKKRGFDSVFFCPISFTAEVPANKQSLPGLDLSCQIFLHVEQCMEVQWNVDPTDPMVCPTELMLLFARVVKVALVPLYIFRTSSQQPVTVWDGGLHHSAQTPLRALNNTKNSGQLTLLFLSGHPTPPSLIMHSKVFLLTGKSL